VNGNIAGTPIRVVDAEGVDVPVDGTTMGEVVIHGNTVALGYHDDPVHRGRADRVRTQAPAGFQDSEAGGGSDVPECPVSSYLHH
jgi:acyl-CoA synthetase (AMP-forming)/AMP-acid ligase II